ncbi:TetR family transcriptional regulator C-terminal domain-containing protein, partial [Kribbella sancticallisti]|uniref:TetR family transcriptional regulator C-terminal domain-containing protein n=1 Tax=Kribbella sancticallisti TaxID=460087 RepID=UPI0031D24D2D
KENLFREAVAYYNDPQRSPTTRALRDQPTARAAVESMLRDNARLYTDPDNPRGCLIVLAGTTYTPDSEPVKDLLKDLRCRDLGDLLQRLHEASVDGELPHHVEPAALARFVITILQGLSIQARDGASLEQLNAVIHQTMRAWDHLTTA